MQSIGRPRQYVSAVRLYAMFPLLRFSYERGAYVLRVVGESRGPVLRKDRRHRQQEFTGIDRRAGGVDPQSASRPLGNVRRIEADEVGARATATDEVSPRPADTAAATPRPPATHKTTPGPAPTPQVPSRVPNTKRSRAAQTQATRRRRQDGRQPPPRPHR